MKIVLIGYMGSGKSTVGRLLAEGLGMPFLDLDSYIEAGLKAGIPEIFKEKGELYFRKMEHHYLREVLNTPGEAVIALGGGTPCYSGNMELLLEHTPHLFYLMVPLQELVERLKKEKSERPLIRDIPDEELAEFIGKHLFERRQFYARATHTIATAKKEAAEIASDIQSQLV